MRVRGADRALPHRGGARCNRRGFVARHDRALPTPLSGSRLGGGGHAQLVPRPAFRWHSRLGQFFHLTCDDQRRMFPIFRAHAAPGAALMFTSGPRHGEAVGSYRGEPLYHASLDEADYRALLDEFGFDVVSYVAEDSACSGHTIWLARLA